jgi:cell division protease FtsH
MDRNTKIGALRGVLTVLATVAFLAWLVGVERASEVRRVPYSELLDAIEGDKVERAEVTPSDVRVKFRGTAGALSETMAADRVPGVDERPLLESMKAHHVVVTGRPEHGSGWTPLLWIFGPFLLLPFALWGLSAVAGGGATRGRPMTFGRSKARLYDRSAENPVTFRDVAGVDEAKSELTEIVGFLKLPAK